MKLLSIDYTKSPEEVNRQLKFNRILAEAALYGMQLKDDQPGVIDYAANKPAANTKSEPASNTKSEMSNDDVQSEILKTVKEISKQIGCLSSFLDDYSTEVTKNGKTTRLKVFNVHEAAVP